MIFPSPCVVLTSAFLLFPNETVAEGSFIQAAALVLPRSGMENARATQTRLRRG